MSVQEQLDEFEVAFFEGDRREALGKLSAFCERHKSTSATRERALDEIVARLDHEHPGYGAFLALAGGALVENGGPAGGLARAIVAPLTRTLVDARRMLDLAAAADADAGDEAAEDDRVEIGGKKFTHEAIDGFAERDLAAIQAWFSLDMWYRPAVATWTRELDVLRQIQGDAAFRAALAPLGHHTETTRWLGLLVETLFEAPCIALFPELGEAWRFEADGVLDIQQLSVLLSDALGDPLGRIGASSPADRRMLGVMRGEGPQQLDDAAYSCTFHIYPVEAIDPADGMPKDGRHEWLAPGGTGTHSLPGDFLPGTIAPRDGHRVMVIVGPESPGMRFTRVMGAVRMFDRPAARVSRARRLSPEDARRWGIQS